MDPAIRSISGVAVAGAAFPVVCAAGDNLALHLAILEAPPGSVLVVSAGGIMGGYWGEVMTVAAQARGIAGLVIDGAVRDVQALRNRRFPVFARGLAILHTTKHEPGVRGGPTVVGGMLVHAGDWVVADEDGVVIVPQSLRHRVWEQALERARKEADYLNRLSQGATTLELYGLKAPTGERVGGH
ncbi:MAG: RraA family protein [Firmicutes bacterium]|nr:RraA family protein [Bacillota bacterium]